MHVHPHEHTHSHEHTQTDVSRGTWVHIAATMPKQLRQFFNFEQQGLFSLLNQHRLVGKAP